MKIKKKGCIGCFTIICIILVVIVISSIKGGCLVETRTATEDEPAEVEQVEETTKVVEQEEEVKYSELNFIKVKRLKKEFGDHITKATISIVEKDGPEYVAQMKAIDNILTELKLAKRVENLGGLEELYNLFIEDIEATVDMLIAESLDSEEYEELHKKVMELDEKFLNEYNRIENEIEK